MSSHGFEFELRVDAGESIDALSDALAGEVLGHLGLPAATIAELKSSIASALGAIRTPGAPRSVKFRRDSENLQIVVSGGSEATSIVHKLPG